MVTPFLIRVRMSLVAAFVADQEQAQTGVLEGLIVS
jgi:hypothetical protein